jgi:hypothetical protein
LLSVGWLRHADAAGERIGQVEALSGGAPNAQFPALMRAWATRWLEDPRLGPGWRP